MNRQEFIRLLDKYLEGTASDEEQALLFAYYREKQTTEGWDEQAMGNKAQTGQHIWHRLEASMPKPLPAPAIPLYRRRGLQVAAAVLAVVCTAAFFWYNTNTQAPQAAAQAGSKSVPAPLRMQGAVLTLSDGTDIVLDNAADGVLARQGNTVVKKWGRKIMYEPALQKEPSRDITETYNRIATAKGAQYQVVLPDGSRAWLNAASAMRFPAGNAQPVRRIEIEGEVYFEVTKSGAQAFRVTVPHQAAGGSAVVEAPGASFNINAYTDEAAMRTTLLAGSLKLLAADSSMVLQHGQQALLQASAGIKISRVDVARVMAWQRGLFDFEGADTREVMRQLARWYDVEVAYGSKSNGRRFSGRLSRAMALHDVLKILAQSGVRFEVQGKKITVLS